MNGRYFLITFIIGLVFVSNANSGFIKDTILKILPGGNKENEATTKSSIVAVEPKQSVKPEPSKSKEPQPISDPKPATVAKKPEVTKNDTREVINAPNRSCPDNQVMNANRECEDAF